MQTRNSPGKLFAAMRAAPPLVHCITNYVAMNIAANVLLAAGASPAMVHAEEEAGDFAAIAGALTINIGTLSARLGQGHAQCGKVGGTKRQTLGSRSGRALCDRLPPRNRRAAD